MTYSTETKVYLYQVFMRVGIRKKVFLTILAANLVLAGAFLLANWWSLNNSFLAYVNSIENRRLSPVIGVLKDYYQEHGNWTEITKSDSAWEDLVSSTLGFDGRSAGNDQSNSNRPSGLPPEFGMPGPDGPPPDASSFQPDNSHPPGPPDGSFPQRLILTDPEKNILHGPKTMTDEKIVWLPIKSDDTLLGYIGAIQHNAISDNIDLLFIKQRNTQTLWILLAAGVISFLFAVPFANRLLKPIENIQKATRTLANGNFDISLKNDRNDELGQLAEDFNRLAKTLSNNLNARQKWVADISHELRTPVALLQAELEAMIDGVRETNEKSLTSLSGEIKRLSFLINDLHELSMADAGALTYNMQRCDVVEILENNFDGVLEDIQISFELKSETDKYKINGDERRLSQLIRNLINNTNKYTDIPGRLSVRVSKVDHQIIIDWMDSEPGVPDEALTQIFDRLYRVDSSRNRLTGGSGLGLSLVKNIVEAHDGSITARHSLYGGLWIQIQFPEYK